MDNNRLKILRAEALNNPEYQQLRTTLSEASHFRQANKKVKTERLERQLNDFVIFTEALRLGASGLKPKEIQEKIGLEFKVRAIKNWIEGKTRPTSINLQNLTANKEAERHFKFDESMAELTGHYLSGLSDIPVDDSLRIISSDKKRLERIALIVGKKVNRKFKVYPAKKGPLLAMRVKPLTLYLRKITESKGKIPFELLKTKEHKIAFLKGFLTHLGSAYAHKEYNKLERESTPVFTAETRKNQHLLHQLLPIFSDLEIFPRLITEDKSTTLAIRDSNELQKMLELRLLTREKHERLSQNLMREPKGNKVYTVADYEKFLYHLLAGGNVKKLSRQAKINKGTVWSWLKGHKPPSVERYLKLCEHCKKIGIEVKHYPLTLTIAKDEVALKPLASKGNIGRPVKDKKTPIETVVVTERERTERIQKSNPNIPEMIDKRKRIMKALENLSREEEDSLQDYLAGKTSKTQKVKETLQKLQKNQDLRELFEED